MANVVAFKPTAVLNVFFCILLKCGGTKDLNGVFSNRKLDVSERKIRELYVCKFFNR